MAELDESVLLRAVKQLPLPCLEWNITRSTCKYNKEFLKLLGLPETHIVTYEDLTSFKYVADKREEEIEFNRLINQANEWTDSNKSSHFSPKQYEKIFKYINSTGEVSWARSRGSIFVEPSTDTIRTHDVIYICTIENIGQVWKKFESEIQRKSEIRNEGELEGIAEAIPHLVWATEPNGSVTYFNDRWTQYTGYSMENSGGWQWLYNAVHPDDMEKTTLAWNNSTSTGQPYDVEYRLKSSTGSYRWFIGRGVPIKKDGKIIRWFGTCTDIHDHKQLEQKIKEAETHLRLIMSNIPVSIFTVDLNGTVTFANNNKSFKELDFISSSHVGTTSYEFAEKRGDFKYRGYIARALKGESFGMDTDYVDRNYRVHYHPLKDEDGKVTGAAVVLNDVTIQKQAEKLAVSEQSAIKVAQMKSEFLSTMSHEIRTPLNGIIGMSELLAETKLSEEQEKYLTIIQSSGSHLLTLINDILDYSKIDSGKLVLESTEFNVVALLESTMSLFTQKFRSKDITVSLSVDQTLTDLTMTADEGRITQILINLVSNALKFTPANGRISVRVVPVSREELSKLKSDKTFVTQLTHDTLTQSTTDSDIIHAMVTNNNKSHVTDEAVLSRRPLNVLFIVKDTGIGVSQEIQQRLFSPFYQALGTNRKFGGTGLGLSICKKLSELMKGEIGVVSREGEGSLFWFELPIMAKATLHVIDVDHEAASHYDKAIHDIQALEQPTSPTAEVLVVEDHAVNRKLMILTLQKLGCKATAVNNGVEALNVLYKEQKRFDIIFMDCHMPLLDGYATSKAIREHERQAQNGAVPIIALTAAAMPGDREKCMEAGMNDYITKPVKRSLIESSLKKWTSSWPQ